jgi:hypothetical protein
VVPPGGWFVSTCWSLLPTGQIEIFDCALFSLVPDSPKWSNMLLISWGDSCVPSWQLGSGSSAPSPTR